MGISMGDGIKLLDDPSAEEPVFGRCRILQLEIVRLKSSLVRILLYNQFTGLWTLRLRQVSNCKRSLDTVLVDLSFLISVHYITPLDCEGPQA